MALRSLVLFAALALVGCSSSPTADLVLTNGTVATLDDDHEQVEALAAADDTLLAVGSADAIDAYVGGDTRVIDLQGRLAVPGFIEGHGHYMGMGEAQMQLDLLAPRRGGGWWQR